MRTDAYHSRCTETCKRWLAVIIIILHNSLAVVLSNSYDLRGLILSVPITYILSYAPAVSLRNSCKLSFPGPIVENILLGAKLHIIVLHFRHHFYGTPFVYGYVPVTERWCQRRLVSSSVLLCHSGYPVDNSRHLRHLCCTLCSFQPSFKQCVSQKKARPLQVPGAKYQQQSDFKRICTHHRISSMGPHFHM